MNAGQSTSDCDRRTEFLALAGELRPVLHRYCARLMGSVIDGEDVVQDTFARALVALGEIEEMPQLRELPTTARSISCAAGRPERPEPIEGRRRRRRSNQH